MIPSTGHSYKATVTAPTCTAAGYTTYTCHCGDSYVADQVKEFGHNFVDGACNRCGEEDGSVTEKEIVYLYTHHIDNMSGSVDMRYEFYKDLTIFACAEFRDKEGNVEQVQEIWASWIEKDGKIVIVSEGEEVESFTVSEDGKTLIPYKEPSEEPELLYTYSYFEGGVSVQYDFYSNNIVFALVTYDGKTEQASAEWGFQNGELVIIYNGKIEERFTVGEDGKTLTRIENAEPPMDEDFRYFFEGVVDGMKLRYEFYHDGKVYGIATNLESGETFASFATWNFDGKYVNIIENGETVQRFTVNADGYTLSMIIAEKPMLCEHKNATITRVDPTCTKEGRETMHCPDCGNGWSGPLPALGHDFTNGFCSRCGIEASSDDLQDLINEMLIDLDEIWNYYVNETVAQKLPNFASYEKSYLTVREQLKLATSFEEVDALENQMAKVFDEMESLLEELRKNCEHINTNIFSSDPTCTKSGFEECTCLDCGSILGRKDLEALGHEFQDNGICGRCGVDKDSEELQTVIEKALANIRETWNYYLKETSAQELPDFPSYKQTYSNVYRKIKTATSVEEVKMLEVQMTNVFDEIKKLLEEDICEHKNSLTTTIEPTCTEDGKAMSTCGDCQSGWTEIIPALGHEFQEDGACVRCGLIESEIIKDSLSSMNTVWEDYLTNTDVKLLDSFLSYEKTFNALLKQMQAATSISEADLVMEEFEQLIEEIDKALDESTVETDLTELINVTLNNMQAEWNNLSSYEQFTPSLEKTYVKQYNTLIDKVKNASTGDDIQNYYKQFTVMIEKIISQIKDNGDVPVEPELKQVYNYHDDYYTFEFFNNGVVEVDITEYAEDGTSASWHYSVGWTEADGLLSVTVNAKVYTFLVNADGNLTLNSIGEIIEPDLTEQIKDTVNNMVAEWKNLYSYEQFTPSLEMTYVNQYKMLIDKVKNASTGDDIQNYYKQFTVMIEKIISQIKENGGDSGEDCKHINTTVTSADPTCTESGFEETICRDCGSVLENRLIAELGHEFQEDGTCVRCGLTESDITNTHIKDCLSSMKTEWEHYLINTDIKLLDSFLSYEKTFNNLLKRMQAATSISKADSIIDEFEQLIEAIEDELHGSTVEPDLTEQIKAALNNMQAEWNNLYSYEQFTPSLEMIYVNQYKMLIDKVNNASSVEEIQSYYKEFEVMLEKIIATIKENGGGFGEDVEDCVHANTEIVGSYESTCTMQGYTEYRCKDCGYSEFIFSDYAPHALDERGCCKNCDHCAHLNLSIEDTVGATCTAAGKRTAYCDVCLMKVTEKSLRLEHHIGSDGICTYCKQSGKKLMYEYLIWNNTGNAYQKYYFYEDLTGYAYQTCDNGTGFHAIEMELEYTWVAEDNILTVYMEGKKLGSFTILEDGSLEPDMGDSGDSGDSGVDPENPGGEGGDSGDGEDPGVDLPIVPDVPVVPDVPEGGDDSGESETPEISYDFGGETVTVMVPASSSLYWDMAITDMGANVLSAEMYERNMYTEEKLNVSLNFLYVEPSNFNAYLKTLVSTGSNEVDFVSYNAIQVTQGLHMGLYANVANSEYIDLTASWWNASYNEAASQFGTQYTLLGDINLVSYDMLGAVYFNCDLMEDFGLENVYELVLNGEWTIEKMREYAQNIYMDLDGNGALSASDRYGAITTKNGSVNMFLRTSGISLITYNERKDTMQVNASDMAMDLMAQLGELWLDNPDAYLVTSPADIYSTAANGNTLFAVDTLRRNNGNLASMLANSDSNFGILPMPKKDVEQAEYLSSTDGVYTVIAVLNDCQKVGVTLDTMGAYNRKNVLDTYQDAVMHCFNDSAEARDVLSLIFDGATWDYMSIYDGALSNATNTLWTSAFLKGSAGSLMQTIEMNKAMINMYLAELEETVLKK